MKRLLFLCVFLMAGSASAQDDYDTLRISRGLDDIAYELRQLRYDAEYAGLGGYYGGGYFPVYQQPSAACLKKMRQHYYRAQRGASKRAALAARRAR